ncbi:sensor histidine kinase [Mangrovicella endophytica]|uniref:sensor histidine kinase n=1 Tax=Mangrovicella endophytica TaxID=2066697 RepID=UPI0018E44897|nr:PAS domain-containing sensor histidine kinase [Mangrovicella endophytica]
MHGRSSATHADELLASLGGWLAALVASQVRAPSERARHVTAFAWLIGSGLAAAVASPLLIATGASVLVSAVPTIAAGLLLAAAGLLAATGRLDLITAALSLVAGLCVTAVAGLTGGVQSPLLLVLMIAPLECWLGGSRRLAAASLAGIVAAAAAAAALHGLTPEPAMSLSVTAAITCLTLLGYAGSLVARLRRSGGSAALHEDQDACEAAAVEDVAGLAVLRFDSAGNLRAASHPARAMLGLRTEVSLPRFVELVHVTDRIAYLTAMSELRSDKDAATLTLRVRDGLEADGRMRNVEARLRAVRDGEGRLAAIVLVLNDIGDRLREDTVLETALEAASRASFAKSQFLAAVSHELRTPLNAIIGFSDILDQEFFGGFESPKQKEYVGLIRQSGEHLLSVVNGILDISKIEAGRYELQPESFDMADVMEATAEMMRAQAETKGLRLDVRPYRGSQPIVADRRACHQMLLNLLSNAVKFTDRGIVTLESRVEGSTMILSVSDTGIGIAAEEIGKLGQPFTQVSSGLARRYNGTGLGLSLVKAFAELHRGSMAIASEPRVGTMVTVRLPLDCMQVAEDSPNLKENVVALTDARTKKSPDSPQLATRRSA